MLDLGKVDSRFLSVAWNEHPIEAFVFDNLEFKVRSNANLKNMKLAIDSTGMLEIRVNPKSSWGSIKDTVFRYYQWCAEQQSNILKQFDIVTYRAQKNRTFKTNDVIYIWGMPYLIEVKEDQGHEDELKIIRPRQIVPALVPKGQSRFSDKYAFLLRNGYINKKALYNLPILNQGHFIMPKHSLWQDSSVFDREKVAKGAKVTNTFEDFAPQSKQNSQDDDFLKTTLAPKSTASNHQEPNNSSDSNATKLNNFYLEQFSRLMQGCQDNLLKKQYFGSRMLSAPKRIIIEAIIKPYTDKLDIRHMNNDTISKTIVKSETTVSPCYKALLKGSLDSKADIFNKDPFLCFDLHQISKLDSRFTLELYDNFVSKDGVRENLPPARMVVYGSLEHHQLLEQEKTLRSQGKPTPYIVFLPEQKDYLQMGHEELLNELNLQNNFYHTGHFSNKDEFYLDEQELTLFTTDGVELDPSLALFAYLPDVPQTANHMYDMSALMAESHASDNFRPTIAGNILAKKIKRESGEFFHKTLVKPGVLRVALKGKNTGKKVQKIIEQYMEQELYKVSLNFLEKLKPYYISVYLAASAYYQMEPISWMKKLEIKKMKPLGQCRSKGTAADIRLNLQLAHYPINVMASVGIHELCHLVVCNHSVAFKYMLRIFCPSADNVSNSLIQLGIVPIDTI